MIVGSIKENLSLEKRVSITPETAKNMINLGLKVIVENNYASHLGISDTQYKDVGVEIKNSSKEVLETCKLLAKVNCPSDEEILNLKDKSILIGIFNPYKNGTKLKDITKKNIKIFSLELLPRISRAQSMDVLSSQSNLAGYQAVIEASNIFNKAMPMMMTAAGTIAPAKVMVFGAGVAGLQAIATAKRLGAIVSATDVRMAAKEQVESLGGKFVMVEMEEDEDSETSGGYAKEMSEEFKLKQAELISKTISSQDIVICTALVPGKKAPTLITEEHVKSMKSGSVIIDLAAESGGNCVSTKVGETAVVNGVSIYGASNITSSISQDASALYAKNLFNFFNLLVNQESNQVDIDWEDEIVVNTLITKDGKIIKEEFMK